ncbi:tyrosine-type recombinase/integrase [Streptomyces scabiei]|uniref:tyrosine-type recombinase/integrase n=1 Tax=Streptomyces scabiei TaxID=1930 RepID=UPI0029B6E456|nr:tyrosine-type recombinase/integrase [Streptomyces scabiei]MDX3047531.1 tyrosine-type recombinase/integrase [Streptomyces scabiei]
MDTLPADRPSGTALERRTERAISLRGTPPASTPDALLALLTEAGAGPAVLKATRSWIAKRPSEHSRIAYAKDAAWWLAFCAAADVDPTRARPTDADDYETALRSTGLAKSTRARRLAAASSWYSYLVRADVADRNPFTDMERPSVSADDSPTRGLTPRHLADIFAYAREHESTRTYALLVVLATTAGRIGSVLALTVGKLGHDEGHRVADLVVKGDKTKRVVLVPLAIEAIDRHLGPGRRRASEYLFATSSGCPMDEPAALRTLRRVAKAAGIPHHDAISPHSLRHSYATALFDKGVPLADIQDAMGHADPRTTRRYDRRAGKLHRSPSYRMQEILAQAMHTQETP